MDLGSLQSLLKGVTGLTWGSVVMMAVGGVLIWLAIKYEYEPLLLLALVYLTITGIIVFAFRKLESRIPSRLG